MWYQASDPTPWEEDRGRGGIPGVTEVENTAKLHLTHTLLWRGPDSRYLLPPCSESWPWQVSLWPVSQSTGGLPLCIATLIDPCWALTAAHCFKRWVRSSLCICILVADSNCVEIIIRHVFQMHLEFLKSYGTSHRFLGTNGIFRL